MRLPAMPLTPATTLYIYLLRRLNIEVISPIHNSSLNNYAMPPITFLMIVVVRGVAIPLHVRTKVPSHFLYPVILRTQQITLFYLFFSL